MADEKRLLVNAATGSPCAIIEVRHFERSSTGNASDGIELAKLLQEVLPARTLDILTDKLREFQIKYYREVRGIDISREVLDINTGKIDTRRHKKIS